MSTRVELEELPTQALLPRSKARVPVTGAIAAIAIAILLAAGFGLLGGRTGPGVASPSQSLVAQVPSTSTTDVAATPLVEPAVTPWGPCGDADIGDPGTYLQVNGRQVFGRVEMSPAGGGPDIDVFGNETGDLERVDVPMDAISVIWVPSMRCALEWYISLKANDDSAPIVLESVSNKALDPAIAAQNRFELSVAPFVGDFELRATFAMSNVSMRATWLIHVPELALPTVSLLAGDRAIDTVAGCGVTQRVPSGAEVNLTPCFGDVERRPPGPTDVRPGEKLAFTVDGWLPMGGSVVCGQLPGTQFLSGVECVPTVDVRDFALVFRAPEEPGGSTLAIGTCATPLRALLSGEGELCGTWYANIRVRE